VSALSEEERERICANIKAQCADHPPPSKESLAEVAALIAAIRIRRARQAAARKTALRYPEQSEAGT
jgi:hypothetical protein